MMYIYKQSGDNAELWFNDIDEWETAYYIQDAVDQAHVAGLTLTVDYKQKIDQGEEFSDGRWCLFIFDVEDYAALAEIIRLEWAAYEAQIVQP